MKEICFDIDNTICHTKDSNYVESKPNKKIISLINKLYNKGHIIKLYTSRGMGRTKDKKLLAEKKFKVLTIKQLKSWKLNYHKIFFGKPSADIYIDDKSLFYGKNWGNKLLKKIK